MPLTAPLPQGPITLAAGPRAIRAVAPPDAPWPGTLARDDSGRACLIVDAAFVPDAVVTAARAGEHVIGVRDLVRRPGGLSVVLPLCTQSLASFLDRRAGVGTGIDPGEVVTIAVSVLRGTAAVLWSDGDPVGLHGTWWLDEDGRPLLIPGQGDEVIATARVLLDELSALSPPAHTAVRTSLTAARALLDRPEGMAYALEDVEGALFAAAAPEPLATQVLAPVRARTVVTAAPTLPEPGPRWAGLLPRVDAPIAEMASAVVTALWRRLRADRPGARRRRPVLWAGTAGALVLTAGLLWPQGPEAPAIAGGSASATPNATAASSRATPSPTPPAHPGHGSSAQGLAAVADALLVRRAGCADAGCLRQVQEDARATFPRGAGDLPPQRREIALLDDFGGVAVLSVRASPGAEGQDQLVVIVRRDGAWLLRDIRTAAPQPDR